MAECAGFWGDFQAQRTQDPGSRFLENNFLDKVASDNAFVNPGGDFSHGRLE
jgi:hypothetical protein